MSTPLDRFPEMTFPAPWPAAAVCPPIKFPAPSVIATPTLLLPRASSPDRSVPIRLPATWFAVVPPNNSTPLAWLAEMTLPAPGSDPPIVLLPDPVDKKTPSWALPRGAAPEPVVPMRFPATTLNCAGAAEVPRIWTPCPRLAEMMLRSAGLVPPIVLATAESMRTPLDPFPRGRLPDRSVPILFPAARFPEAPGPERNSPARLFPARRLPVIALLALLSTARPYWRFPRAMVPEGSVPRRLP